jgi:Tol biopolymer transport system component
MKRVPVLVAMALALVVPGPFARDTATAATPGKILFIRPQAPENVFDTPPLAVMNADGTGAVDVPNTRGAGLGELSPDGKKIVYAENLSVVAPALTEIVTINVDGTGKKYLTDDLVEDNAPKWSPDGSTLLWYRDVDESTSSDNFEIFTSNADGTNRKRLTTSAAADRLPTWSPNGKKIAFVSSRAGWGCIKGGILFQPIEQIYTMNPDGTGVTRIAFGPDDQRWSYGWVDWHLDQFAITRRGDYAKDAAGNCLKAQPDGYEDVYVASSTGTGLRNLTSTPAAFEFAPSWAPDGSAVVATGDSSVFKLPVNGGPRVTLIAGSGPSWQDTSADAKAPTGVTVTYPHAGGTVSGAFTIAAIASDDHGVTRLDFVVDGTQTYAAALTKFGWVAWQRDMHIAVGSHTVVAKAYDLVGNSKTSPSLAFTVK